MSDCPFQIGQTIEFEYPDTNQVGIPLELEHRRFQIRKIRDVLAEPLKTETYQYRPYIRRARFLLGGFDLDKQEWRSFYADSMGNIVPVTGPLYRIGLYDPVVEWKPVLYLDEVYTLSPQDQARLKMKLAQTKLEALSSRTQWCVGVFQFDPVPHVS